MLMQYWFPFRGCSPFWFVLGLKIEILESCWLQMLCFKRKMKENRLFFAFLFVCTDQTISKRKESFFFLFVLVLETGTFFLPKENFFFLKGSSPSAEPKIFLFIGNSPNPKQALWLCKHPDQILFFFKSNFIFC